MKSGYNFFTLQSAKYSKSELCIFTGISFLLLVFLVLRAISVPMTHDEIGTFIQYVQTGEFWPFIHKSDGNNHLLNTLLTYVFYHLFGSTPLVLRLPNLVFAPFYFFFIFKISELLHSKILGWVFFITMAFSLHYIEFMALSRGYGLAITFLAGALWQFCIGIRDSRFRNLYFSFLFVFLASTAILTLTYTYLLMTGFVFLFFVVKYRNVKLSDWLKLACFGVLPILFLLAFSLFVKSNGAYLEGNSYGLWHTTFKTLIMSIADLGHAKSQFYLLILTIILFVLLVIVLIDHIRERRQILGFQLSFPYFLFGNIAITYLTFKFLGLNYPGDRMSFYFYPLIVGSIFFLTDMVLSSGKSKYLVLLVLPLIYFPLHFVKASNLEYSVWYKDSHIPYTFYEKVMEDYKPGDIPPSVSAHGLQAFAWMFFIRDNAKAAGFITKTPRPNHFTQYQIIDLQFFEDWQSYYDTIGYDEISKMHLLQNKRDFTRQRFATIDTISTKGIITDKAFGIFEGPVDSIRGKTVEIDFDFSIQSYKSLLIGGFAVSINDSTGQNLFWDSFFLNWIGEKWDGKPHNFRNRLLVEIPATASSLKIYFWNTKKTEFSIVDGRIQMSILREKTETGD